MKRMDLEEKYRKRIESSGWYGHLQTLGQRSLEEFIGSEIMFIEGLLEEEREQTEIKAHYAGWCEGRDSIMKKS